MRILGIEIAGNYDSAAIKEATAGVETFGRTVNEAATKNIERLAAQRVKLQELAREYQVLAASADKGSAQQVAALDLAARAQKRLGTEVLTTNALIRTSARETAVAEGEIAKFARGSAKASGSFGKLGLGLALGSGGFIAGALVTGGVKKSIDDAKALMDAQDQLAVAARNVGDALDAKQVNAYLAAESKLATFTKADLVTSLVQLERTTGNAAKAEADATLAANIARGAHVDLATATQALIGLEAGRTRGLATLGVKIPVVKTAQDALKASGEVFTGQQKAEAAQLDKTATALEGKRILLQRYAGAAKSYSDSAASSTDRLSVAENKLGTSIGTVLLPVVSEIAGPFAKWAQKEADSGDAARKTKEIVGDLTTVLRDARTVIKGVDDVTGGFKHTLELLIGLKVASVFAGWAKQLDLVSGAFGKVRAGAIALSASEVLGGLALFGSSLSEAMAAKRNQPNVSGFKKVRGGGGTGGGSYVGPNGDLWIRTPDGKMTDTGIKATTANSGGAANALPGTGGIVGSPVPTLGGGNSSAYFKSVLAQMGIKPTAANIGFLNQWAHREGVPQSVDPFNLLGTTLQVGGSHGTNGPGVQAYGSFTDGVKATALMLSQGNFKGIRAALASGNPGAFSMSTEIQKEFRSWSGGGYSWPSASGVAISLAGAGGTPAEAAAIAALIAAGKHKPPKAVHGSALIDSGLLDKIVGDKNNATDSSGGIAAMWLRREKADLEKARTEVAAKLKGASPKQKTAIDAELRTIDTQIAGVNKSITTNLKAQAAAIKANAASAISSAKAGIASAFGQIITDAQSAFSQETQDYIDNVLSAKYLQGTDSSGMRLQTSSEKKLADMQAADTASQLQDALASAKKQLTDDTTGALLEHVVNITTGATKDIFGPAGTPEQRSLDQKAIDAAQRALDENTIAIDAAKERAQEDYDYAQAVKTYQQQRSLAEAAMTRSLTGLEKGIENGTASMGDLQDVLLKFGVSVSDIPTDQWTTDWSNLSTATQTLAQVMLNEAAALAKIGDGKDAAAVAATAASISWQAPITAGQQSVVSGLGGANGYFLLNPVPKLAGGGDVTRAGIAYLHPGERVQPADVVRGGGGGGGITIHVNAPHYVGDHAELAAVLKSPAIVEAVSTAVLVGNRRGHLRAAQLT